MFLLLSFVWVTPIQAICDISISGNIDDLSTALAPDCNPSYVGQWKSVSEQCLKTKSEKSAFKSNINGHNIWRTRFIWDSMRYQDQKEQWLFQWICNGFLCALISIIRIYNCNWDKKKTKITDNETIVLNTNRFLYFPMNYHVLQANDKFHLKLNDLWYEIFSIWALCIRVATEYQFNHVCDVWSQFDISIRMFGFWPIFIFHIFFFRLLSLSLTLSFEEIGCSSLKTTGILALVMYIHLISRHR